MVQILILWFGVFASAAVALLTASQYVITPIWVANVLAAIYIIKLRRYFTNYFLVALLPFTAILLASLVADQHQETHIQVILALLSAGQTVIFVYVYYSLIKNIEKFTYKRTVLLTLPNFISTLICAALFSFIPEEGVRSLIFFDYFLEQIATGFSLVCLLYGWSEIRKIRLEDYALVILTLIVQYLMSISKIFSHAFILPVMLVYFTIHYHFKSFIFVMGLLGLTCSIYLVLPLSGQYWERDQMYVFAHLSTYRVGIACFTVVFLLLSELQMRHRSLSRYLEKVSFYDELTYLKNRRYLKEKVLSSNTQMMYGTILLVDIDNFKKINDKYGHNVGDHVLKLIAQKIQEAVNLPSDIFRWGGEEFLILLRNTHDMAQLKQQCQQVIEHCETEFLIEDMLIPCSVSMGVKQFTAIDVENYHQVIDRADQMLYQAKANGKNQYIIDID